MAVDGNSTDGCWEFLRSEDAWIVRRQSAPGLAAARNEALELARGDFIAFHDVDDEWLEGKIEAQLGYLECHPEIDFVTCLLRKVGDAGRETEVPGWTPSACMFRKEAFEKAGYFDPRYKIACDHDWFVRARRKGLSWAVIDRCLLIKRIHDKNLSNDRATYRKEMFQILRSHG